MFPPTQEPFYLIDGQCCLLALPQRKAVSDAGYIAHKLVKKKKSKVAQKQLDHVRFGGENLSNSSHLEYLDVMQSGVGDPLQSL